MQGSQSSQDGVHFLILDAGDGFRDAFAHGFLQFADEAHRPLPEVDAHEPRVAGISRIPRLASRSTVWETWDLAIRVRLANSLTSSPGLLSRCPRLPAPKGDRRAPGRALEQFDDLSRYTRTSILRSKPSPFPERSPQNIMSGDAGAVNPGLKGCRPSVWLFLQQGAGQLFLHEYPS